jgi:hypothetical protein
LLLVFLDFDFLGGFFGLAATLADAGEAELTFRHPAAGGGLYGALQLLGHGDLGKICDRAAAGADEMHMGFCVGIEALDPTYGAKALDNALILKESQVPVNRGQGNVWVLRLEHLMQHFR